MEPIQGIILGVIQGLTEFLPVSSSGHLVLTRHLFGLTEPDLFFDTSVHVGTMLAVLLVFRQTIVDIFQSLFSAANAMVRRCPDIVTPENQAGLRLALLVVVGSFPTFIIGLIFDATVTDVFASLYLVGAMLLVTAAMLFFTRGRGQDGVDIIRFSTARAFWVGLAQGLAVLPGLSRSGATIAVGMFLGMDRKTAAEYSFVLSIPAIFGAELLSIKDMVGQTNGLTKLLDPTVVLGTATAFVVGYLALTVLLKLVHQGRFYLFSPYCLIVGLLATGAALL